jgi:hypothetical protein
MSNSQFVGKQLDMVLPLANCVSSGKSSHKIYNEIKFIFMGLIPSWDKILDFLV